MNKEKLCKLKLLKAEYGRPNYVGAGAKHVVRITAFGPFETDFIDIQADHPDQTANELEAVAAMIRVKARVSSGDE